MPFVVLFCLIFCFLIAPCFLKLIFLQGGERSSAQFISCWLESLAVKISYLLTDNDQFKRCSWYRPKKITINEALNWFWKPLVRRFSSLSRFYCILQLTGRTLKNFPNMVDQVVFFLKWGYSLFSVNYSTCVSPLLFDRIEFSSVICDCRVTLVLFGSKLNANHQRFALAEGLFGAPHNSYLTKYVLVSSRLENAFE